MQIQQISFQGNNPKRAANNIPQLMNRLYASAYRGVGPDIIQISTKMRDGKDVTCVANFDNGKFINLVFPYEHAHYKNEFCSKILKKFNDVITKGKTNK